jgi:hemerythrin-like domain-containing protein
MFEQGMGGEPDPFQRLLDEHADFLDKLAELEATLDEMIETHEVSDAHRILLDEAIRFFDDELLPHFHLEERTVIPALEAKIGRYGNLVSIVGYEHEEIRRGVAKFKEARHELDRSKELWPVIQELNRHGIFTVQFLWDHFRKERTGLFPAALKELSTAELAGIRDSLRSG